MSHQTIVLFNLLFQKDPGIIFHVASEKFAIHFEPNDHDRPWKAPLTINVRIDDNIQFQLRPEAKLLDMMLADVASLQDLITLPEQLRAVALESALERVLDHIDQLGGTRSTIDRVTDNPCKQPPQLFFRLIRKKHGSPGRGSIVTDQAGMQWLAARIGRLTPRIQHRLDHLPTTGRVQIAETMLPLAEFSDLEPNDIVLTEVSGDWEDYDLCIRFSQHLAFAGNMVEPDRILIQNVITGNNKREEMTTIKDSTGQPSDLPVDDIPVKLVFEIGRTDIPLGELKHLQPGYTIQLEEAIDKSKPVTLRANGVAIGRGEIVIIDNLLGIRILEISKDNNGSPS
jgi:type III secretion protein Q